MVKQHTNGWSGRKFGNITSYLVDYFRPVSLEFFKSTLNSFLARRYYQETDLPKDSRILIKYTTQTKGSLFHQFILMALMLVTVVGKGGTTQFLLELTGGKGISMQTSQFLTFIKNSNSLLVLLFIAVYFVVVFRQKKR